MGSNNITKMSNYKEIVSNLKLESHPEGGFFKRIYQSEKMIETSSGLRHSMTSINFLLTEENFSGFHLLTQQTEIVYFHQGSKIRYHCIDENGTYSEKILSNVSPVQIFQPNTWIAGEVFREKDSDPNFALISAAVSPGFDFADSITAKKEDMKAKFPEHLSVIEKFCRI